MTMRTLRGFVGPGNDGKIFAVAVSPDGKTIAAGGYFGAGLGDKPPYGDIRLFDFSTGKIKAVLKAPEYADLRPRLLAGRQLSWRPAARTASSISGSATTRRRPAGSRSRSSTPIPGTSSNWPSPTAARGWSRRPPTTASGCGTCRPEPRSPWPRRGAAARPPVMALAVSADGALFATGSNDGAVAVCARPPTARWCATMPKQDFLIGSLTFAAGGARLVASCGYRCADKHRTRRLDRRRRPAGAAVSRP